MAVSSGLQKHFDSQHKKKSAGDVKKRLKDISAQVNPAFMSSFIDFRERILDIVEENPQAEEMVLDEVVQLDMRLQNSNRVHSIKRASAYISAARRA